MADTPLPPERTNPSAARPSPANTTDPDQAQHHQSLAERPAGFGRTCRESAVAGAGLGRAPLPHRQEPRPAPGQALFRHKKLRYRGLVKNTAQLHTLFALANLVIVKKTLLVQSQP